MKVVVFLGPSLPLAEARQLLPDAVFQPPARHADLVSSLGIHQPDVIGLIDGEFAQSLSVWHKEILFALGQGVRVLGAASMGALRAAELASFGMQGVGDVYQQFASGQLTDDDEVAVVHTGPEHGFATLSHAMINLRATLERMVTQQLVGRELATRIVETSKQLNFAERCLPNILEAAQVPDDDAIRLSRLFAAHYVDVKANDVRALLAVIRDRQFEAGRCSESIRTPGFDMMYDNDRRVQRQNGDISLRAIGVRAALHQPDFEYTSGNAMNRALVQILAESLEVEPTAGDIADEETRFLRRCRIMPTELPAWLVANDLSRAEYARLIRELAVCRRLQHWLMSSRHAVHYNRWLLDELRLRGQYADVASDAVRDAALVDPAAASLESVGELAVEDTAELVARHQLETGWRTTASVRTWAEEAGFKDLKDLAYALLQDRRAREHHRGVKGVRPDT